MERSSTSFASHAGLDDTFRSERVNLTDQSGRKSELTVVFPEGMGSAEPGLILCLHGAGGCGSSIARHLGELAELCNAILLFPTAAIPPSSHGNLELAGIFGRRFQHPRWSSDFDDFSVLAIDWAKRELGLTRNDCAIVGHSMGAIAAWELSMRFPQLFSSLVSISGTPSMWELIGSDAKTEALMGNLINTPVMVLHGDNDDQIPVDMARANVRKLEELGHANATLVEVTGGCHGLETMQLDANEQYLGLLANWIIGHQRQTEPKAIQHVAFDDRFARSFWLEMAGIRPGDKAVVAGSVSEENVVEISVSNASTLILHLESAPFQFENCTVILNGEVVKSECFDLTSKVGQAKIRIDTTEDDVSGMYA